MNTESFLKNIKQLCEETGLSRKQISTLFQNGRLGFIVINKRKYVPASELKNFYSTNLIHIEPKKRIHNDIDLAEMRRSKKKAVEFNSTYYFEQLRRESNGISIQKG
jgi:hypothetical protein